MELMFFLAVGGVFVGLFVNLLWLSVDAILGASTITETAALGVCGIFIVLAECIGWGAVLYDEFRS